MYSRRVSDVASHEDRPDAEASAERSIGRYLASQRRLRGISLDELAARTKIPRRNLERLESGAFDAQPDGFVRGFVRTVAQALGLDPQEAVMRLVGEPQGADEDWRRRRIGAAVGIAVVAGAMLVLVGLGLRFATRWIVEPSGGAPEVIYRPDAVRSLAGQRDGREMDAARPPRADEPGDAASGR